MQIRYATEEDLEELMPFYVRMNEVINKRSNKYNPDNESFPSLKMVTDAIADQSQFIGIEDGKIVIATIMNHQCPDAYMDVQWQVELGRDEFWVLHALRVAPEYEGRGFAKQMINHIVNVALERFQKAIRLDVLEGYEVEAMYHRFGFKYIDTIEILYEDIGYPTRFRLLEKVL